MGIKSTFDGGGGQALQIDCGTMVPYSDVHPRAENGMERPNRNIQRRFPKLYALVEKAVGAEQAAELMDRLLEESRAMGKDGTERASYAYVAFRRYLRGLSKK